jgi:hypothetical protein
MLPLSSGSKNKIEATCSFELFVDFKRTVRPYIPEGMALEIYVKIGAFE